MPQDIETSKIHGNATNLLMDKICRIYFDNLIVTILASHIFLGRKQEKIAIICCQGTPNDDIFSWVLLAYALKAYVSKPF